MGIPRIEKSDMLYFPVLGRGGMSRVKKVKINGCEVAVKIPRQPFSPNCIAALYREANVLTNLSGGPNIVSFKGFILLQQASFNSDHTPCSTFELIDGPNLKSKCIDGKSPLPPNQALDITADIALALAYMHQMGIVHRDVKPANILFNHGSGKLIDFHLAKEIGEVTEVIGTQGYLPPECFDSFPLSERTDIFALGITLFEITAGMHALKVKPAVLFFCEKPDFSEVETRVKASSIPVPMKDLILRMAALSPDDRPLSCEGVIEEVAKTKERL